MTIKIRKPFLVTLLSLFLTVLAMSACADSTEIEIISDIESSSSGDAIMENSFDVKFMRDGEEVALDEAVKENIKNAATSLLQSCSDRSKRLFAEPHWNEQMNSGERVLVKFASSITIGTRAKTEVTLTELLVPVNSEEKKVFARNNDTIYSPFTAYDPAYMREIETYLSGN